jgi:uncharacterized protein YkwD
MVRRFIPFAVPIVLLIGIASFAFVRSAQPHYVTTDGGVALGPAQRRAPAAADIAARLASGALNTAAGSASNRLLALGAAPPTDDEQKLLDLTNTERASNGLAPVRFDLATLWVARARAESQVPGGPLSHYDSMGELAFVGLLGDAAVGYTLAGENLARASAGDAGVVARLNTALMNSPTHRANILEPAFNLLAIGQAAMGSDGVVFAEIFRSSDD